MIQEKINNGHIVKEEATFVSAAREEEEKEEEEGGRSLPRTRALVRLRQVLVQMRIGSSVRVPQRRELSI